MSDDEFTCGCGATFDTLDELADHAEEEHDKNREDVKEKFGE